MQVSALAMGNSGCSVSEAFQTMMPGVSAALAAAFRRFRPEQKEDALQEALANAFTAFAGLWERGRQDLAFPSVLARYAVAQWFGGRRVGGRLNSYDVLSPYAQRRKRFYVERLDRYDPQQAAWREAVVEDRQTPVPDQVAFRIDFPDWLHQLSRRDRRIAETLAQGEATSVVARRYRLTPGRVSQIRRELRDSWQRFHGEEPSAGDRPCQ
jgi:hypothetical protein